MVDIGAKSRIVDFVGIFWEWIVVVVRRKIGNAEINTLEALSNFCIGAIDDGGNNDDCEQGNDACNN